MNMKKIAQSKIGVFGRQLPVFLVALIFMASVGVAVTLSSYGTITGTATVEQSIVLSGEECDTEGDNDCTYTIANSPMYGDSVHTSEAFTLTNRANVPVGVTFTNGVTGSSDGTGSGCGVSGADVSDGVKSIEYLVWDGSNYILDDGIVVVPADDGNVYMKIRTTFADACPGGYTVTVNANTNAV